MTQRKVTKVSPMLRGKCAAYLVRIKQLIVY